MASSALFFSFFLLSFSRLSADSPNNVCRVNRCRPGGPPIHFPFRIRDIQDEHCGFPGLDLSCDNRSQAILQLPNLQDFVVDSIDYKQRYVSLKDPDNCLAKRLTNSRFSSSLLVVRYYESFVFANCSVDFSDDFGNHRVSCLSGEQYTVMFRFADDFATRYFSKRGCSTWTVSVPMGWLFSEDSISLTWDLPECRLCEASGGRCGPKGSTDSDFGCIHKHGMYDVFRLERLDNKFERNVPNWAILVHDAWDPCDNLVSIEALVLEGMGNDTLPGKSFDLSRKISIDLLYNKLYRVNSVKLTGSVIPIWLYHKVKMCKILLNSAARRKKLSHIISYSITLLLKRHMNYIVI